MNATGNHEIIGNLLVVDDTPDSLQFLVGLLREQGYNVRGAINGPLALEAIMDSPPELILLDIRMPGMDGFEVCTKLKQRPDCCDIPIIFISALEAPGDKIRAFEAGGVDYITKPLEPGEVLVRVGNHLELARSRQNLANVGIRLEREVQERTAALAESEAKYRRIFESVEDGYLYTHIDGTIHSANPAAARILGYDNPDQLIGKNIGTEIYADAQQRDKFLTDLSREERIEGYLLDFTKRDGQAITVDCSVHLVLDQNGQSVGIEGTIRDATERIKTEQELKKYREQLEELVDCRTRELRVSERRFRTVFEQAAVGMAIIDSNTGQFVQINQRFCDIVGYSSEEMTDICFQQITYPDDLQPDLDNMERLKTGEIREFTMETRYWRKNGSLVWVNLTISPFWAPNTSPDFHIAVVEDISQRKSAEEAVQQLTDRLSIAVRSANIGIWDWDVVNDILEWDQRMYALYGRSEENTVNAYQSWKDGVHPDDIEQANQEVDLALKGEMPFETEFRVVWPDRSIHHLKASAMVQRGANGKPVRMIGVNYDVTAQKKLEGFLRESERRLKESQDFAHLGHWELDLVRNKLTWSKEVFRIFEIDPEHFDASYDAFLNTIHPEDREAVNKAYTDSLANKIPYTIVHRLLMPDGRIKYVREQCRSEFEGSKPLYSIGTVQDITTIKESEERLRQANERLQEVDQLKSLFIASMSHELRTPLNSIIGFSGMMLSGIGGKLSNKHRDYSERLHHAGRHLLTLISDIIDISKIEAGRIKVVPSRFSLQELVNEALDTVRADATRQGLTLHLEKMPKALLHTDRSRLLQCLLNLLSNGVKYTEQGRVTLEVELFEENVTFIVSDTGIGIAGDDFQKLFQPFERIESHLKIKAGGTGLGLYLTKKISTELLKGDILFDSILGKGSVFRLQIPHNLE
ncbi:PAS domain S-box protein [Magnetococcales bacterium HHB-1]